MMVQHAERMIGERDVDAAERAPGAANRVEIAAAFAEHLWCCQDFGSTCSLTRP